MTESLSALLPRTHPLASKQTLRFCDIDGETFLIYTNIGFWRSIVERELPHATFLWQEDRSMFEILLSTSDALAFSTEAARRIHRIRPKTLPASRSRSATPAPARRSILCIARTDRARALSSSSACYHGSLAEPLPARTRCASR